MTRDEVGSKRLDTRITILREVLRDAKRMQDKLYSLGMCVDDEAEMKIIQLMHYLSYEICLSEF